MQPTVLPGVFVQVLDLFRQLHGCKRPVSFSPCNISFRSPVLSSRGGTASGFRPDFEPPRLHARSARGGAAAGLPARGGHRSSPRRSSPALPDSGGYPTFRTGLQGRKVSGEPPVAQTPRAKVGRWYIMLRRRACKTGLRGGLIPHTKEGKITKLSTHSLKDAYCRRLGI